MNSIDTTATPLTFPSLAPSLRERCCHVRLGDLPIGAEFAHQGAPMRKLANDGSAYLPRENRSIRLGNETVVEPDRPYAYVGALPIGARFRLIDGNRWLTAIDERPHGALVMAVTGHGKIIHLTGNTLVVLDHQRID